MGARVAGPSGFERATCNATDLSHGIVNVTLLTGPQVNVPYIGFPPVKGDNVWLVELAPGVRACIGAPAAPRLPMQRWHAGTAPSSTSNVLTVAQLDTIDNTIGAEWPTSTTAGFGIVVPWTGWYLFVAQVGFAANATSSRLAQVLNFTQSKNVATAQIQAAAAGATNTPVSGGFLCTASDEIRLEGRQQSGGALNFGSGYDTTFLELYFWGPVTQPTS